MLDKARRGLWPGGKPPTGYVIGASGKLSHGDSRHVEIVCKVFEGYLAGHSLRALTAKLNAEGLRMPSGKCFTYQSVRFILANRNYTGDFVWNVRNESKYNGVRNGQVEPSAVCGLNDESDWIVIPSNHPAIIGKDTFAAAQRRLASRRGGAASTPHRAGGRCVLSGLLRCGKCNSAMTGNTCSGHPYYVCSGYFHRGAEFCDRNGVRQDLVLSHVVDRIVDYYTNPKVVKRLHEELFGDNYPSPADATPADTTSHP